MYTVRTTFFQCKMDESKKINAGKYRNKQRYKNKAKVVHKDEPKEKSENNDDKIVIDGSHLFEKRSLESNWYRYEPKEEGDKDNSRDFSLLASAPIQQASYFQFKSDKSIANTQDIKQIDNELFHLNVNLLNLSIETVPFHIRCGIDRSYFTERQLEKIEQDSEDSIIEYKHYLETSARTICVSKETDIKKDLEQCDGVDVANISNEIQTSIDNSLENKDLEQWLEDILDD